MRLLTLLFTLIIICSCQDSKKEKVEDKKTFIKKETTENLVITKPKKTDSSTKTIESELLKKIDSTKFSIPFYSIHNKKKYFIVTNAKKGVDFNFEYDKYIYGIANDSLDIILNVEYDKIYNPNMTLNECFEIKKDNKIGLFNYNSQVILKPQFDFILPSLDSDLAYGYKNNKWHIIRPNLENPEIEVTVKPEDIEEVLSFNVNKLTDKMMHATNYEYYEDDSNEGNDVFIVPSYMEYLKLSNQNQYLDVINKQNEYEVFGIESLEFKTKESKSLSEKLTSFFVTLYETGVDGRGYSLEKEQIIVYNSNINKLNSFPLLEKYDSNNYCEIYDYKLLNNNLLEIRNSIHEYSLEDTNNIYNFETRYSYVKINEEGTLSNLTSNRYFDFTKFVFINKNYFKGCFAKLKEYDDDGSNLWRYDHLSIADLDLMRNEIFADYGYVFKSEKWINYFKNKSWYTPKYENVDNMLTEKDKANINVILEVKQEMKDNEDQFRNKRKDSFHPAG